MRFSLPLAWLGLALLVVSGCAPSPAPQAEPAQPDAVQPAQTENRPAPEPDLQDGPSLKAYLQHVAASQYASAKRLTSPPPPNLAGKFHMELVRKPARLILASNVADFAADADGLAIGRDEGTIQVVSPWPCSSLSLPGSKRLGELAWSSGSPILAATDTSGEHLHLYDLRTGQLVAQRSFPSKLTHLTISSEGTWIAAALAEHDLVLAPASRPKFQNMASLRYPALALQFTPREGVFMVVDAAGWLTLWAPLNGEQLQKHRIPGGPFQSARFVGELVVLTPEKGKPVSYNIADQRLVPEQPEPSPYRLEDGVLSYRTRAPLLVKELRMAPPQFSVHQDKNSGALRVDDVDGRTRYYAAEDGLPLDAPPDNPQWAPVEVDKAGRFQLHGRSYSLAARAAQWEHMRLNCRSLPEHRFYLWWSKAPRPTEYAPHPEKLPAKTSILEDGPLNWTAIEPSKDLL
jgi:hypothetical protein